MSFESVDNLIEKASNAFTKKFSRTPTIGVCAPGRVNLIGEHTDYNEGFVFPMALPLVTVIVGAKSNSNSNVCKMISLDFEAENVEFLLPSESQKLESGLPSWANYAKGVIANFHCPIAAFDAVVVSSVPIGGGLSSSAALEVAMYTFLESLMTSQASSLRKKALACQKAEHDFANVPCGIMDQFISTMGVAGNALLIDCRSLESTLMPLNDPKVTFVIINSNVKHSLSGSEYPTRRNDCYSAAAIMEKRSLREASLQDLEESKSKMSIVMVKRVRHVITEIARTSEAKEALVANDYLKFGKLMNESHASLKLDYEVSCKELDEIVDIVLSVPGVYGSRMTGGGFGGCTVTLVKVEYVADVIKKVDEMYSLKASFYVCSPSDGAKVVFNQV